MSAQILAIDPAVRSALQGGAVVAFSLSGGKDSAAGAHAATAFLDEIGHPRADRVAIHADLGRAEWRATPKTVEQVAAHFDLELMVVRHNKHDMVSRWEARFTAGKRRYANLDVFNLIGPWSSASLRFCTSEMKEQVIMPALRRRWPGRLIVSVVGIRRDESPKRRLAPISKATWASAKGPGRMITWHPILDWSADQVFACHRRHQIPLHEAYSVYGSSRVSCAFCIMQSRGDQLASSSAKSNEDLYRQLVEMEARSTFSFQPENWLGDVAPHLLPATLRMVGLHEAKLRAKERRGLEAALPAGLRYVKGWPPREPTRAEAEAIVAARAQLLAHHNLAVLFPTPASVIERFRALMSANAAKVAA